MPMFNANDEIACRCGICDWAGPAKDLEDVDDLDERLDPGSIVPAGECPNPDCCSLAYYEDEAAPEWTSQGREVALKRLNAELVAALEGLMAFGTPEDDHIGAYVRAMEVVAKAKGGQP